jgi:hypothetical protein
MKKFAILSIALFIVFTFGQVNVQASVTDNNKIIKKPKTEETTSERPPLRKLDGTTISQDSQTSFYMTIGNVPDIKWIRGTYYDEATYNKDGQDFKAYFDINGALVGTTTLKKATELSNPIEKSIKKQYPDATIGQVTYFQDNEDNNTDMIMYGIQFESKTQYFIEVTQGANKFVVMSNKDGDVTLFKQL